MFRRRVARAIAEEQLRLLTARTAREPLRSPSPDGPWQDQAERLVVGRDTRPYLVRTAMTRSSNGYWLCCVQVELIGSRHHWVVNRLAITMANGPLAEGWLSGS